MAYVLKRASQLKAGDQIRVGELAGTIKRVSLSPALPEDDDNDYQPETISTTVDVGRGTVVGFELFPDERVEVSQGKVS